MDHSTLFGPQFKQTGEKRFSEDNGENVNMICIFDIETLLFKM